jgi:hypothetical protein
MKDIPVSWQTAELLKQCDFDWDSAHYYDDTAEIQEFTYFQTDRNYGTFCGYPEDLVFFAPSQSLVQKWFREKHGLHISIGVDDLNWNYQILDCSIEGRRSYDNSKTCSIAGYWTYEEALEVGLLHAFDWLPYKTSKSSSL